jgi:hypothetical protein
MHLPADRDALRVYRERGTHARHPEQREPIATEERSDPGRNAPPAAADPARHPLPGPFGYSRDPTLRH